MTITQQVGMLMLGVRDSISLQWIKRTLLYVDPQTKKVHPSSKVLFDSLKSSIIKITLYTIIVPYLIQHLNFLPISALLKVVYLLLTYGYLFFYNNDILVSTRKLLAWQQKRTPRQNFQIDNNEKIQFFTQLSTQIKAFIFLLFYYVPIYIIETKILTYIPYLGTFLLILSESFFNGVFYFMKTWPFDSYNIGFMQKNMSYMIGYGLMVSLVCNYFLAGSFATGAYLVLSLWMLINTIVYSPPLVEFRSFQDIIEVFTKESSRNKLKNAYNNHRIKIRKDPVYRQYIIRKIFVVYPALKITSLLNKKVSLWISKSTGLEGNTENKVSESEEYSQFDSSSLTGSGIPSHNTIPPTIKQVEEDNQQQPEKSSASNNIISDEEKTLMG